jgi:hypothetical protein
MGELNLLYGMQIAWEDEVSKECGLKSAADRHIVESSRCTRQTEHNDTQRKVQADTGQKRARRLQAKRQTAHNKRSNKPSFHSALLKSGVA